ncbi:MAG: hypothetical protein AVDCRST_MAG39-2079 [uncultured Sphingomonadaceae bacterium]|uniref:Tyr recombinase domain-containing protein n=1 Tax=uncultured Sphingomonadaceae bacterium TaxID=169976 RepID=A0A6J4T358_9SPHN|nr:MAG: hypothetical protein AVDCRST_MAG39-2079 [uncultured Sphingomonadaceae bacterium]
MIASNALPAAPQAEAVTDYLERLDDSGGKNMGEKPWHLNRHLIPYFRTQQLDGLKDSGVKQYGRKRRDAGASRATVNRELSSLSHMTNRATEWKRIKPEHRPRTEKEAEPRKKIVVLSDEHSAALMRAAMEDQDGRLWLFVAFGLGAAMRRSEILRVRYDQIDFVSRRVFIPQAKAGAREQPITPTLAAALERQRAMEDYADGWISPAGPTARSDRGHRGSICKPFLRAVVRAKLDPEKVTLQVTRHTAITQLAKAGVDLPNIQRISGHKALAMVPRYTHIHGEHIDAAIGALDVPFPDAVTLEIHTPGKPAEAGQGAVVQLSLARTAA